MLYPSEPREGEKKVEAARTTSGRTVTVSAAMIIRNLEARRFLRGIVIVVAKSLKTLLGKGNERGGGSPLPLLDSRLSSERALIVRHF